VTAPLDSKIILDGVTRRSTLELARKRLIEGSEHLTPDVKGLEVVERVYTMLEIEEAVKEGRLVEAFVSGTAVSFALSKAFLRLLLNNIISISSPQYQVSASVTKSWMFPWLAKEAAIMLVC
jgi:hypothetical protein